MDAVIICSDFGDQKIKSITKSTFSLYIFDELPTLVFFPGESHEQRSLVGYSPWDHKESDTIV